MDASFQMDPTASKSHPCAGRSSPVHGNPDPDAQHPVVMINKTTHEVTCTGGSYYLGPFSKFVRPGAVRVETTGSAKGVCALFFVTPEGGTVARFLSNPIAAADVSLEAKGNTPQLALPARPITTATCWPDGVWVQKQPEIPGPDHLRERGCLFIGHRSGRAS